MGANDGTYSRMGLEIGAEVVAFDIDPVAVERNYAITKQDKTNMLPLLLDLTNPSPAIGFANEERKTLLGRGGADCVLLLAVIHHIAISNNVPLEMIAEWLARLCKYLIVEFVPKEDSQVRILLATRDDIFSNYTYEGFERDFGKFFEIISCSQIEDSKRSLYLMRNKRSED